MEDKSHNNKETASATGSVKPVSKTTGIEDDQESTQACSRRSENDPKSTQAISSRQGNDSEQTKTTGRRPGRPSADLTPRQRQQHSRLTARACRARQKIRFQYLAEIVKAKENSVFVLRREFNQQKEYCKTLDRGEVPRELAEDIGLDKIGKPKGDCQNQDDTNDLTRF